MTKSRGRRRGGDDATGEVDRSWVFENDQADEWGADWDNPWDRGTPAANGSSKGSAPATEERRRAVKVETRDAAILPDADADDDFPDPVGRGRGLIVLLIILALLAGIVGGGWFWVSRQIDPPGDPGVEVAVNVPRGASAGDIANILDAEGIVADGRMFSVFLRLEGDGAFQAGTYSLRKRMSFREAMRILQAGPSIPAAQRLVIPEGYRLEQIAQRVGELPGRDGAQFLDAMRSGAVRSPYAPDGSKNLEGLLFPETYLVDLGDDETAIARRMVDEMASVAEEVGISDAKNKVGLTPYEVLIVASLVEREAKLDVDRPKIAQVIYNRLKKDMPLQIDATTVYELGGVTRVFQKDLEKDGPYNTYTRRGLPPTPIAAPGKASIEAALNPTAGDWLFYVVTETNGGHSFASTLKEQRKNIKLAEERGLRQPTG